MLRRLVGSAVVVFSLIGAAGADEFLSAPPYEISIEDLSEREQVERCSGYLIALWAFRDNGFELSGAAQSLESLYAELQRNTAEGATLFYYWKLAFPQKISDPALMIEMAYKRIPAQFSLVNAHTARYIATVREESVDGRVDLSVFSRDWEVCWSLTTELSVWYTAEQERLKPFRNLSD